MSGVEAPATRDLYSHRMKAFLGFAGLTDGQFVKLSAAKAEEKILRYIQHLKGRVSKGEIAASTIRPSVSPIRAFSVMNRQRLDWAYILKTVPHSKRFASDRAPTVEEIRLLLNHAPLRMKAAVLMLASGGLRIGAFDYLKVQDVQDAGSG